MSAGCKIMQHGLGKLVDRLAMEQFPLKKQPPVQCNPEAGGRGRPCSAFTLLELLVVLAVVSLLAATLVPTLAGSRIGSQAFRCMNNNRQLVSAWRIASNSLRSSKRSSQRALTSRAWSRAFRHNSIAPLRTH